MQNKSRVLTAAAAAMYLLSMSAHAQVSEDGMGKVIPVELYACSYHEGMGPDDLDAVVTRFNAFMDERGTDDYAAWLLTPYYYGAEQDFDLVWMGASTDGNAMFSGTQQWLAEGGEIAAAFDAVMHCPAHVGLSSAMYQAPTGGSSSGMSVIAMSDCTMNEGTRYSDVRSGELEWAAFLAENDGTTATYHWFPGYGGGDQDYDYKLVHAYVNFEEFGARWEAFANGGGRMASNDIFDDLDDCDDARVYVVENIRSAQLRN